jgi:hypothetical protein
MKKVATQMYVLLLWILCGIALYSLFRTWWPSQKSFWDSTWTADVLIAIFAALIVEPQPDVPLAPNGVTSSLLIQTKRASLHNISYAN